MGCPACRKVTFREEPFARNLGKSFRLASLRLLSTFVGVRRKVGCGGVPGDQVGDLGGESVDAAAAVGMQPIAQENEDAFVGGVDPEHRPGETTMAECTR